MPPLSPPSPPPLWTLVATELRLLRADGLARAVALGLLALFAYAGWTGLARADARRADADAYRAAHAGSMAELRAEMARGDSARAAAAATGAEVLEGAQGPHPFMLGTRRGAVVTPPLAPLAAFAVGQSDLQPPAARVTVSGVRPLGSNAASVSPEQLLAGPVDMAFVVLVLLPLVVLAVSYGLTSGEREAGRLRMLLGQPVGLGRIAAGKVLARALVLGGIVVGASSALFVASGGLASGGLTGDGATSGGAEDVARWGLWTAAALVYGAVWLALAAYVDTRVRRPATAALVLVVGWLAAVVVVPAAVTGAAQALFPMPSRVAYVAAQREATAAAQQEGEGVLASFYADHPELAPPDTSGPPNRFLLREAREARVAAALAPLDARFERQKARQHRLSALAGALSPTVLAHRVLIDVAGTGAAREAVLAAQARAARQAWAAHFLPLYACGDPLTAAALAAAPTPTLREPPPRDMLARVAAPLALLVALALALAGAAARRYARAGRAGGAPAP